MPGDSTATETMTMTQDRHKDAREALHKEGIADDNKIDFWR